MRRKEHLNVPSIAGTIALLALLAVAGYLAKLGERADVDRLEGRPRLVDGDSFHLEGREVRLEGIDAPEGRQTCTRGGREVRCGEEAKAKLAALIGGRSITCEVDKRDQHQRLLSFCTSGNTDLNREMVESGFALAFGKRYLSEERRARDAKRGVWAGDFERPSDWRRKYNSRP